MTNTHVEFTTGRFRGIEPEYFGTDLCQFGEDCARWLAGRLRTVAGIEVMGDPERSDCGWEFQARLQPSAATAVLKIGLVAEDPPRWRIWILANRRLLWGLLVRPNREIESRVAQPLHAVLGAADDIGEIRWHESRVFLQQLSNGT
jgi:hypothetical protein